jgi:hypothetical protein
MRAALRPLNHPAVARLVLAILIAATCLSAHA